MSAGIAEAFHDADGTIIYFENTRIVGDGVEIGFHESTEDAKYAPPHSYTACLFVNHDMIACDHGATWEQAMAYISAVLSAKTAEEAAGRYGELHPRFTADELIRRVRNPNWEAEWESEQAALAAA
jgi:hypothetical protein